jgi:hypothetical protein
VRSWSLGIVAALLLADPALADPGSIRAAANSALTEAASGKPANGASLSLDEHFTTNALDSDLEFSDFYTELRGSITRVLDIDGGYLRFAAEGRASRYDRISIEDDRSLLLLAAHSPGARPASAMISASPTSPSARARTAISSPAPCNSAPISAPAPASS